MERPVDTDLLAFLIKIAKEDGIVDESERSFIAAVNVEIKQYKTELEKAIEDGEIDTIEQAQLFGAKLDILKKAMDTVRDDMEITNEERKLIDSLEAKLKELSEYEKKFIKD